MHVCIYMICLDAQILFLSLYFFQKIFDFFFLLFSFYLLSMELHELSFINNHFLKVVYMRWLEDFPVVTKIVC